MTSITYYCRTKAVERKISAEEKEGGLSKYGCPVSLG
jgi:hypothetical protein